jgi:hypothetical protein
MLAEGKTLDQSFSELRKSGASIAECIISVKNLRKCELTEAKKIVNESETWADVQIDWKKEFEKSGD